MKSSVVFVAAWLLFCSVSVVTAVDLNLSNPSPQFPGGQDHATPDLNGRESKRPQCCEVVSSSSKASGTGGLKGGNGGASDIAHRAPPAPHKNYSTRLSSSHFYTLISLFSLALTLYLPL
ncbi:unnamed protein product [Linum tenue]|uniref:Uncharacterized protein n=1 Tax=Linum tenue TaxID=586396 RepID=A0AAV0KHK5_9ROSI|nr:unnamed protein product [Linum tenue]